MCTAYDDLADQHSPYFSMGLGNYYITTPGTFAFINLEWLKVGIEPTPSDFLSDAQHMSYFSGLAWTFERSVPGRLRGFWPTEYQAPLCKSPDSPYFRITICYQTLIPDTEPSLQQTDNPLQTEILQLFLLMSPPQPCCPSQSMLILQSRRSPLTGWIKHVCCLLTQTPMELAFHNVSEIVTSISDLYPLPGLFLGQAPLTVSCQLLYETAERFSAWCFIALYLFLFKFSE